MTDNIDGHGYGAGGPLPAGQTIIGPPGPEQAEWPVFLPADRQARIEQLYAILLSDLVPGWWENPHMADTPARVARWWTEFIDYEPGSTDTTFEVEHVDQMVAVTGIDTWSLCAHHLLPFSASVSVGYIADGRVLGLSKFARITHQAAHRPTSQEQLCADIADRVQKVTGTDDVAVTASGLHLCMAMRGIRTPATMTTSVTRGQFRTHPEARAEWFAITARTQRGGA